jgi:ribose transport system substrate-binding protein
MIEQSSRGTTIGRRVAMLGTLVVVLAACGGGTGSAAPSAAPESAAPESAAPASEAPASAEASSGAAPTGQDIIAAAGINDDTSFCGNEPIKLGIHDGFGVNPWSQASMAAARLEANKCPNVEQVVVIGGGDLQKSISDVSALVTQGVDGLVIIPDFGEAQLASLQEATAAGVKVVPWAADPNGTDGTDFVEYVDWSSPEAGKMWAEWMVGALGGQGKVVFLGGPAGNPVTAGQLESVVEVFAANPGMELLTGSSEWPATNWDPATAQQQMTALLGQYPQIDGVISDYGSDLAGAIRAFQAAGRELVPMSATEANSLGCFYQDLKAANPKFQLATISSRNWLGRIAVRKALAAVNGVPNEEPARYSLPLYEDSIGGQAPTCDASLSPDFYHSNLISAEDVAEWGVVE